MNIELLENKIGDIDGKIEEIRALNETITEFIEDVKNIDENSSVVYIRNRASRIIYFTNMIYEKSEEISKEINNLISCLQSN